MIPNPIVNNTGTFILDGEVLVIQKDWGIRSCAFYLVSGTASYRGEQSLGTRQSDTIPMAMGIPVGVSNGDVIENFTIDASGGKVVLITRR